LSAFMGRTRVSRIGWHSRQGSTAATTPKSYGRVLHNALSSKWRACRGPVHARLHYPRLGDACGRWISIHAFAIPRRGWAIAPISPVISASC
jgi:hypothetical protein